MIITQTPKPLFRAVAQIESGVLVPIEAEAATQPVLISAVVSQGVSLAEIDQRIVTDNARDDAAYVATGDLDPGDIAAYFGSL